MRRLTPAAIMFLCCFSICSSQSNPHGAALVKPDNRLHVINHSDGGSVVAGRFRPGAAMTGEKNGKYGIIVYSSNIQDALQVGVQPRTVTNEFFTTEATLDQIDRLSKLGSVKRVALAKRYKPLLDKSVPEIHADQLRLGSYNGTSYTGKHVIMGFVDTGIDWKHLDFRSPSDTTKSRILWIWDQTITGSGSPPTGTSFTSGTEYSQPKINAELGSTPPGVVKEVDSDGHGTHVAGIAAGNGSSSASEYIGVAPDADIVFVKTTFQDVDIIDGITYIRQKAAAAGEPFVINLSLGSQDGAHDGTDPMETEIDEILSATSGSAVVVAAGNEGSDAIHADSTVSTGRSITYQFSIPAYTPSGVAQNDYVDFDMWYNAGDQLTVSVTSPRGHVVTVSSGSQNGNGDETNDGDVQIFNAANGPDTLNSEKECAIQIINYPSSSPAPLAGLWTITITGAVVTQGGAYDIWLSDASMSGDDGSIPEFLSGYSFRKLVSSPGTSKKAITVGSYVTRYAWESIDDTAWVFADSDRTGNFSTFSSMGPTRDGRQKPDLCAPGEVIVSALSKDTSPAPDPSLIVPDDKHIVMEGTSMAAPHIAGVAALMLQAKPSSTSDQLKNAMISSGRKDSFTGSLPNPLWGYGKIDATGSMGTVLSVRSVPNTMPRNFSLEQNYPNPFNPSTQIQYTLPENFKGNVSLTVFDVLGKKVTTLVNEQQTAGTFSASWNAASSASGVYFCILRAGSFFSVKKMVLMK